MKEKGLYKDDKQNYLHGIRSNLINLHIEQKRTLLENMEMLDNRVKVGLQDQFRKLRNHFDVDYTSA